MSYIVKEDTDSKRDVGWSFSETHSILYSKEIVTVNSFNSKHSVI